MSVIVKWFAPEVFAKIKANELQRMQLAVRHLRNKVIQRLGIKYPPASTQGTPPHLRTGQLRNSIATEVVEEDGKVVGRVGTNVKYAKYLELPEYLDRSFLLSTLKMENENIRRILVGKKIT